MARKSLNHNVAESHEDVGRVCIHILYISLSLEMQLKNVRFINSGAEYLPRYIKPNSIQNIY